MKIVLISSYGRSLIDFRGELIQALLARGCQVVTLAPDFNDQTREELAALGVGTVDYVMHRAGMNPFSDFLSFLDIYKKIRAENPTVVLSYFIKPVMYGTIAAWLARVPKRIAMIEGLGYVYTYTKQELNFKVRMLKLVVNVMYRLCLRLANKVIFLNPDDQSDFVGLGLADINKSMCIGGIGINLNKWHWVSVESEGPLSFLMVARLLREKGIFEYVKAAELVKLRYPQTKFLLLGGVDENPGSIQLEQVSSWHEQGVLTWYGHVPVAEHMKVASVFVLPSYREGVPVSTMEAMAMGRPIISTDVPGCRETVVDGVNGFIVPAKDAVRLAEKMIWYIENPSYITTMGAASRKIAEKKFDVHRINAKLIEIILGDENEKTI